MPDYRPIKVPSDVHKRLTRVIEQINQVGWTAVGSDRKDAATLGTTVDFALTLLEQRITEAQKERKR